MPIRPPAKTAAYVNRRYKITPRPVPRARVRNPSSHLPPYVQGLLGPLRWCNGVRRSARLASCCLCDQLSTDTCTQRRASKTHNPDCSVPHTTDHGHSNDERALQTRPPPPLQAAAQPSTKAAPTDRDSHTGRSTRTGGDFASSPAAPLFPIHRPPSPLVDLDAAPTTDTPLEAVCKWVDAIAGRRRTGGSLPSPSHSSAHARR